jgi:signal transduction histidine kinase
MGKIGNNLLTANKTIRALLVEDSEDDALLLILQLKKTGYQPVYKRVETIAELRKALDKSKWDIVIADYFLPEFSGLDTLKILQQRNLDIPCLIVSGKMGEETAVEAMKAGARDYIMKDNLSRLGPAIERELQESVSRRQRRLAEEKLRETNALKSELEKKIRQELELFNHKIIQAQEEERKRIVRDLHEDTVQLLAIIKLELESLYRSNGIKSEETRERLKNLQENADHAMQDIRRLSYALRPGDLEYLGLDTALSQLAEDINEHMEVSVEYQIKGQSRRLNSDIELVLFRIVQEALSNIQKHSRAATALITMNYLPDKIKLVIHDNGCGFIPEKESETAVTTGRLGLIGMRERAHLINANLKISSKVGLGTSVSVEFKTNQG